MAKKVTQTKTYNAEDSESKNIVKEAAVSYNKRPGMFVQHFSGSFPFKSISNKHDYITVIKKGIEKRSLDRLMELTDISTDEMAQILHTTDRTLRRYNDNTLLNSEQSERIVELTRLYSYGEEVFGSLNAFKEWMNDPVLSLGNKKPKEFLDTSLGIEILMEELGRIEHGIFG